MFNLLFLPNYIFILVSKTYEDYLKDLVQEMTEPDLYQQVFSFPMGELESKYGIKPVSESTKGKLTYFLHK